MKVAQLRSMPSRQEQQPTTVQWQLEPISPTQSQQTMASRMNQQQQPPLTFSIDDRLAEQHLTRLDLCSQGLKKIEKLPNSINFNVVLLDHNEITKVEQVDVLTQLIQLSIAHNRLIDIRLISRLRSLQKLNLSQNSIDSVESLKSLQNLVMLNIAGNNIQNIAPLNACHALQSLDASDNTIRLIEDLSSLTSLKYLNLHKNFIDTLTLALRHWPKSIHTLVISDNEIQDLNEVFYLTSLIDLNTLYIVDNPCLSVVDERHGCHQPFDYRPYILNWCLSVQNLDGVFITRKESLKAEWLLSQGKGRSFRPGDHFDLVQYLIKVCGTDADERDDLHLSRIMLLQDFYTQQKRTGADVENHSDGQMMTTSDTMKDANDTLSKDTQAKLQQSLLISESEFVKMTPSSSVSSCAGETTIYSHRKDAEEKMRTPSPGPGRAASVALDDQTTEQSSSNRYTAYDNRPMKPLDKNMFQTKLNEYPIGHHAPASRSNEDTTTGRPRAATNPRPSVHLAYNANRYSPKITTRGPTTSSAMHVNVRARTNKTPDQRHRTKRHTIAAGNAADAFLFLNHRRDENTHRTTKKTKDENHQQQTTGTSNENKRQHNDDDDDLQLKSAPVNGMLATQSTMTTTLGHRLRNGELKKLTTSVESMRTSILQAYLDLHERFTKTTELQTSAMAALWKMCETQNLSRQRETDKIVEENRLLHQRLRELEARLNTNGTKSVLPHDAPMIKSSASLFPPLRAHISKRDTKSFFLHWVPNPQNEHQPILGYRIYIDDVLKGAVDANKFEVIINDIRDEGEYRIKIRAYDEYGESPDSNIVIARFRRQQRSNPTTPRSDANQENISETTSSTAIHRTQSDHTVDDSSQKQITHTPLRQTQSHDNLIISPTTVKAPIIMDRQQKNETNQSMSSGGFPLMFQQQATTNAPAVIERGFTTPEKQKKTLDELVSPSASSPSTSHQVVISQKPPKSPASSPGRGDMITTSSESCSKVLFTNNNSNDPSSTTTKRSPTRAGIMSRLAKSPHKIKRNNILLNALPPDTSIAGPTEAIATKSKAKMVSQRTTVFQPDFLSNDRGHFIVQQLPMTSIEALNSMTISLLSPTGASSSSPPPPPIPPRASRSRNNVVTLFDQPS